MVAFWFRRDLRLFDNAGLFHALQTGKPVLPVFIFDKAILDKLEDKDDARVTFIHQTIQQLQAELTAMGSSLCVKYGNPLEIWQQLSTEYPIEAIYTNHDYEPYAKIRDEQIGQFAKAKGIDFRTFKDQVIFEKSEVVKDDGTPFIVYTPYSKKWKSRLTEQDLASYNNEKYFANFHKSEALPIPSLAQMGFEASNIAFPSHAFREDIVSKYHLQRDIPAIEGTTKMSLHLRFGTVSVRQLTKRAQALNEKYLNELIWREFYQMILWQYPHVVGNSFKPDYDRIPWLNNEADFDRWCKGNTGEPIVDAGMRELNATGFMHNRVRMIAASYLTKDLLIDWRWGEAYFARKLLDFDLASNNGGWQWAAGSGVDAAPYFRVFNPVLQAQKFDPDGKYIKRWVPELDSFNYPRQPMVDHIFARDRALKVYKEALGRDFCGE